MTENTRQSTWKPVWAVAAIMVLVVGPAFGPIATVVRAELGIRNGAAVMLLVFALLLGPVAAGTVRWVRRNGGTLEDLGWRVPSRLSANIVALLFGVAWAAFNIMGYVHQIDKTADPFELSWLRLGTALGGASLAICEDLVTRGFVMNHLKKAGANTLVQVFMSSLIFATYHAVWTLSIAGFIVSMIYGLILSGFFVWGRRSLTPVVIAHGAGLLFGEPFLTMFMLAAGGS
jgi:membrane protease YdiL (CAAX protease family)